MMGVHKADHDDEAFLDALRASYGSDGIKQRHDLAQMLKGHEREALDMLNDIQDESNRKWFGLTSSRYGSKKSDLNEVLVGLIITACATAFGLTVIALITWLAHWYLG